MPSTSRNTPANDDFWLPSEVFGRQLPLRSNGPLLPVPDRYCPFQGIGKRCNKKSKDEPLGICSFSRDGNSVAAVCPQRFRQDNRIFNDVAQYAFGDMAGCSLRWRREFTAYVKEKKIASNKTQRIKATILCQFDYLLGQVDLSGTLIDYCAIETQSVYFSGDSMVGPFKKFLKNGEFPDKSSRRMDWPSSAKKRLLPQLRQKVILVRKKLEKQLFVVVDRHLFESLGKFPRATGSVDFVFVVYDISLDGNAFKLSDPQFVPAQLKAVENAVNHRHRIDHTRWDEDLKRLDESCEGPPSQNSPEANS